MTLEDFNLDQYGIPEDANIRITIFLIASDLRTQRRANELRGTKGKNWFCDLCHIVLPMIGFDDRPSELYRFYFELLEQHCNKVTYENDLPINEAFIIYKVLKAEKQNRLN